MHSCVSVIYDSMTYRMLWLCDLSYVCSGCVICLMCVVAV